MYTLLSTQMLVDNEDIWNCTLSVTSDKQIKMHLPDNINTPRH
jgi:hypothetical protein